MQSKETKHFSHLLEALKHLIKLKTFPIPAVPKSFSQNNILKWLPNQRYWPLPPKLSKQVILDKRKLNIKKVWGDFLPLP